MPSVCPSIVQWGQPPSVFLLRGLQALRPWLPLAVSQGEGDVQAVQLPSVHVAAGGGAEDGRLGYGSHRGSGQHTGPRGATWLRLEARSWGQWERSTAWPAARGGDSTSPPAATLAVGPSSPLLWSVLLGSWWEPSARVSKEPPCPHPWTASLHHPPRLPAGAPLGPTSSPSQLSSGSALGQHLGPTSGTWGGPACWPPTRREEGTWFAGVYLPHCLLDPDPVPPP